MGFERRVAHMIGCNDILGAIDELEKRASESTTITPSHKNYLAVCKAKLGDLQPLAEVTLEPDERVLVAKLGQFTEVVDLSIQELMPHHICTYLYELAQEFNRFYERNRVVDDPRQVVRAGLVLAYADTLRRGLDLLGIHAPERM